MCVCDKREREREGELFISTFPAQSSSFIIKFFLRAKRMKKDALINGTRTHCENCMSVCVCVCVCVCVRERERKRKKGPRSFSLPPLYIRIFSASRAFDTVLQGAFKSNGSFLSRQIESQRSSLIQIEHPCKIDALTARS